MLKTAIILAAGQGRRLWPYTKNTPKCLLQIGDKAILEHQMESLEFQGIDHIVVVTGYLEHKVRQVLGSRAEYIENREFEQTSSMYSLWLARKAAGGDFLVLNSDVLFHPDILKFLLTSPFPDAIAIDPDVVLGEEEMKVRLSGSRVIGLSKEFPDADAENVGILKFSRHGGSLLFSKIQELLQQNTRKAMVPYALNAIVPTFPVAAVLTQGLPWIEVDFPEDYQRAQNIIYPAILCGADGSPSHRPGT